MRNEMLKKVIITLCVIFGLTGNMVLANDSLDKLKSIVKKLPKEIQGWKQSDDRSIYSPENLYEYINGGAELYISYQFKHLHTLTYIDKDSNEIKIDLFDMGSSYNAYGIFVHGREEVDNFISPDIVSEYASGLLTFWKAKYYVSILAYPETEEKKSIVKTLAGNIAEQIQGKSEKPDIISMLSEKGLEKSSVCYFRHFTWMNKFTFILDDNYLNFDSNTHAVTAKYNFTENEKKSSILIVIQYTDSDAADTAYQRFLKNVLPDAEEGFKKLKDSKWAGCKQDDNIITIAWNASDKETAEALINSVKN
jgi:hypothetical protein